MLGVDSKADLHLVDEDDLVEEVSASNQSTSAGCELKFI